MGNHQNYPLDNHAFFGYISVVVTLKLVFTIH